MTEPFWRQPSQTKIEEEIATKLRTWLRKRSGGDRKYCAEFARSLDQSIQALSLLRDVAESMGPLRHGGACHAADLLQTADWLDAMTKLVDAERRNDGESDAAVIERLNRGMQENG